MTCCVIRRIICGINLYLHYNALENLLLYFYIAIIMGLETGTNVWNHDEVRLRGKCVIANHITLRFGSGYSGRVTLRLEITWRHVYLQSMLLLHRRNSGIFWLWTMLLWTSLKHTMLLVWMWSTPSVKDHTFIEDHWLWRCTNTFLIPKT